MTERLYLDRHDVHLAVGWDDEHRAGLVSHVVCEHPDGAEYAALLAARFGVPLQGGQLPAGERLPAREQLPDSGPLPGRDGETAAPAVATRRQERALAT